MDPMSYLGTTHYRWHGLKMQLTLPASPLADIESSVGFGIAMMTTSGAGEPMAIPTPKGAADVTALAGVVRGARFNRHRRSKRFVPYTLLQLIERPIVVVLASIRLGLLSLLGVLTNTREIFKPDATGVRQ